MFRTSIRSLLVIFGGCKPRDNTSNAKGFIEGVPGEQQKNPTLASVYIVRHGEEQVDGPHLNDQGRQRANLLSTWFTKNPKMVTHGLPIGVFGASPKSPDGSLRSIETCVPYAQQHGLSVNEAYTHDETKDAATSIEGLPEGENKSVIVCWKHEDIPDLAHALGATQAPDKWDHKAYDRVWKIEYKTDGSVDFQDLPQNLLPGDSAQ